MPKKKNEELNVKLGQIIRKTCDEKKVSIEKLAEGCGYHRTYLYDVLKGQRNPSITTVQAIADVLGTTASVLLAAAEQLA